MPRITPFRVVFLLVAGYLCLLGLWLALPFPQSAWQGDRYAYHQHVLRSGGTLTTVHEQSPGTFSQRNVDESANRNNFAIDWQLITDRKTQSILLKIGSRTTVNLTHAASPEGHENPVTHIGVTVKSADRDGVNPPWFAYADAALLYWDIHRDMMETDMTVKTIMPGQVQIWSRLSDQEFQNSYMTDKHYATFVDIPFERDRTNTRLIQVVDMSYDVPSQTYLIRHFITMFLAPVTLAIVAIAGPLSGLCFGIAYIAAVGIVIYSMVLYVCWAVYGFPPWRDFREQFPLARAWSRRSWNRKRTIWGSSGPLPDETDMADNNIRQDAANDHPRPLTSPLQFFRSSSPLNDLCATFEITRWMLQPLNSTSRRITRADYTPLSGDLKSPTEAKIKIMSPV